MDKDIASLFRPFTSGTDVRFFNIAKVFNKTLNTELKESEELAFLSALNTLRLYIKNREKELGEPFFNVDLLYEVAEKLVAKKRNTFVKRQKIGLITHGLVLFGCSREKAVNAMSMWPKPTSVTKIKNAQNQARYSNWAKSKWTDKEAFADDVGWALYMHILDYESKKKFPEDCKETLKAYKALCFACEERHLALEKEIEMSG